MQEIFVSLQKNLELTSPGSNDVSIADESHSATRDDVISATDITRTFADVTATESICKDTPSSDTDAVVSAVAENAIEEAQRELRSEIENEAQARNAGHQLASKEEVGFSSICYFDGYLFVL